MQEKLLVRVSLLMSLAGLAGLFLASAYLDIDRTPAGSLTPDDVGRGVRVCGQVENKFTSKAGHVFFDLADDSGEIGVVVFNSTKAAVGNEVCVTGRVDMYEGGLEVIAQEVERA